MPSTKAAKFVSSLTVCCLFFAAVLSVIALSKSRLYFAGLGNTLQIGFKTTTFCRFDSMGEQMCVTKNNKAIYDNWLWSTNPFSSSDNDGGFTSSSSSSYPGFTSSSSDDVIDLTIGCDQLFIIPYVSMYATWSNLVMLAIAAFFGMACFYNQNGGLKCGLVCFTCWVTVNAISVVAMLAAAADSVCGPNAIMSLSDLPTFRYEQSYYLLGVALGFTITGAILSIIYCCMPHPPQSVVMVGAHQPLNGNGAPAVAAYAANGQTVQYAEGTVAVGQPVQQQVYYQPQQQQQQQPQQYYQQQAAPNGYPAAAAVQEQAVYQPSPTMTKE